MFLTFRRGFYTYRESHSANILESLYLNTSWLLLPTATFSHLAIKNHSPTDPTVHLPYFKPKPTQIPTQYIHSNTPSLSLSTNPPFFSLSTMDNTNNPTVQRVNKASSDELLSKFAEIGSESDDHKKGDLMRLSKRRRRGQSAPESDQCESPLASCRKSLAERSLLPPATRRSAALIRRVGIGRGNLTRGRSFKNKSILGAIEKVSLLIFGAMLYYVYYWVVYFRFYLGYYYYQINYVYCKNNV